MYEPKPHYDHESDLSSDVIIIPGEGRISDNSKIKGFQHIANSTKRTKKEENKGILTEIKDNKQSEENIGYSTVGKSVDCVPIKVNVKTVRECLTYKRDIIVHFISKDSERNSSISKLLKEIGAIEPFNLRNKKPKIGQIVFTTYNKYNVFSVALKEKYFNTIRIQDLTNALMNLKSIMVNRDIRSLRISRRGDLTDDLEPGLIREMLMRIFSNSTIKITICYGKVQLPRENERQQIIAHLHDSLKGGHKEGAKAARRRITDTPIKALDKVSIDTVGKLRMMPSGNCHLLTMQCNLTKYLIAIPIKNLNATTIADVISQTSYLSVRSTQSNFIRSRDQFPIDYSLMHAKLIEIKSLDHFWL
ncbi:hypothetical protein TSAR_010475 [Trichomalopsis sarcophagae]|uniref:Uncharacterized protein n=1 Tax=Trichomalopsis sarcophagae TaxID=543379 RepID=A0A232EHN7_9HYME|nr:hypothetical protein TSAR_010475 [Trichomalopsis sarcophagae]